MIEDDKAEEVVGMDELLSECLSDLEVALQWLELPYKQRPPSHRIKKCRDNILIAKAYLAARAQKETPLKWLNLPTGIYHPLMRAGYRTVESVSSLTPTQLLVIPRIGTGYRDEILRALESWHQEPKIPFPQDLRSES